MQMRFKVHSVTITSSSLHFNLKSSFRLVSVHVVLDNLMSELVLFVANDESSKTFTMFENIRIDDVILICNLFIIEFNGLAPL